MEDTTKSLQSQIDDLSYSLNKQIEDNDDLIKFKEEINKIQAEYMQINSLPAASLSRFVGYLEDDDDEPAVLLNSGDLTSRFVRNTNVTGSYKQRGGTCYAYAAASAYINTIMRIYGSRPPPSFTECYKIAHYCGDDGGDTEMAVKLLEAHFQYGVRCDKKYELSIRDAITISTIVVFATSRQGWQSIARGSFMEKAEGPLDDWHASLIEGYDFEKDCLICKNSWGKNDDTNDRFDMVPTAAHQAYYVRVYYTDESIKGLVKKKFRPKMKKFKGILKGKKIKCAWMDETTATYSCDYICAYHPERYGHVKQYLGYDVNQWININLNR